MTDQFPFEAWHESGRPDSAEPERPPVDPALDDVPDEGYAPSDQWPDGAGADETEDAEPETFEQRLETDDPEVVDDWDEDADRPEPARSAGHGGGATPVASLGAAPASTLPTGATSASAAQQPGRQLYPPIEPYWSGRLDVGDGQSIYWEECGNPDGKPAVYLHGGPGAGSLPEARRFFDPARYRILLLDQRGCGRSRPLASEPGADLSANTTWHLVADLERLREDRGIERWLVFGGSWGSALALAYAEEHPDRVTELVLRGIFTLRRSELDWYYNGGAAALVPDRYEKFLEPLGGVGFSGDTIAAYARLLDDPDPAVHLPAGLAWSIWEASTITLVEDPELVDAFRVPAYALAFARIENHYFRHGGWFEEGQLIARADRLAGIPGVVVQGRYDLATPPFTAWDLHRAWPAAELTLVPDAGHSSTEPGTLAALLAATDRFAGPGDAE